MTLQLIRRGFGALVASVFLVACGASEPEAPTPGTKSEGVGSEIELIDQTRHTWPKHSAYELNHQLVVRTEDPALVLEIMGIQEGMAVGDLGCGSGYYTFLFAPAVGASGKVWAIDIQQGAVDYLKERVADAAQNPLDNIEARLSRVDDTLLAPGSLDVALFSHADFYAYASLLDENRRMLESTFRTMKPGGRLVVLQDLTTVEGASAEIIAKNFKAVGFEVERQETRREGLELYLSLLRPAE